MSDDSIPALSTKEIGDQGELHFETLARAGRMVVNPAKRDEVGFDHVLHIRTNVEPASPDQAPRPLRAWVQVKTHLGESMSSASISLSNWSHMIADPEPWFVLLCRLDARGRVVQRWLQHVDEACMEEALKRLRQAGLDGKPLNNTSLSVSVADAMELPNDGLVLRQQILKFIGDGMSAYCEKKSEFYKSCGFGEGRYLVTLSFPERPFEEHVAELTEISLGLKERLSATHARVVETRFDLPQEVNSAEVLSVSVHHRGEPGWLLVSGNDQSPAFGVDVIIYSTLSNPQLSRDEAKVRLAIGPLSLIIGFAEISRESSIIWNSDRASRVLAIGQAARTLRRLSQGPAKLTLTTSNRKTISFSVSHPNVLGAGQVKHLIELESASEVAGLVNLTDLELTAGDLFLSSPRFWLQSKLLTSRIEELSMHLDLESAPPPGRCAKVIVVIADLGSYRIFCCAALVCTPRPVEDRYEFFGETVEVDGVWAVEKKELDEFDLEGRINSFVERLERSGDLAEVYLPREDHTVAATRWQKESNWLI